MLKSTCCNAKSNLAIVVQLESQLLNRIFISLEPQDRGTSTKELSEYVCYFHTRWECLLSVLNIIQLDDAVLITNGNDVSLPLICTASCLAIWLGSPENLQPLLEKCGYIKNEGRKYTSFFVPRSNACKYPSESAASTILFDVDTSRGSEKRQSWGRCFSFGDQNCPFTYLGKRFRLCSWDDQAIQQAQSRWRYWRTSVSQ